MECCPGKSHEQRSLGGYSTWDHKEQDSTERLNNNRVLQTKADWGAFEKEWWRYILQIKPVLIKILTNIEDNDCEALCHPCLNLLSIESVAQISMRCPILLFSLNQINQPWLFYKSVFPCGSDGKKSTCNEGHPGARSLGWEDPLKKGKATHSSILTWRIPCTVQSNGSQTVGHD